MANATKAYLTSKPVEVPFKVVLELSEWEAIALRTALRKIGGSPQESMRGYMDEIASALAKAEVPFVKDASQFIEGMHISDRDITKMSLEH